MAPANNATTARALGCARPAKSNATIRASIPCAVPNIAACAATPARKKGKSVAVEVVWRAAAEAKRVAGVSVSTLHPTKPTAEHVETRAATHLGALALASVAIAPRPAPARRLYATVPVWTPRPTGPIAAAATIRAPTVRSAARVRAFRRAL